MIEPAARIAAPPKARAPGAGLLRPKENVVPTRTISRRASARANRIHFDPSARTVRRSPARPLAAAGAALLGALLLMATPASAQRSALAMFVFLDADGNGVLTRTELRRTSLQAKFHLLDRDGDGAIDCAEFVRVALDGGRC